MSIQAELLAAQQVPLRYLVRFNPRPTATKSDESCYLPMEAISEFGAVDSSRMRPTPELAQGYSFVADGDVAYAKVTPCFENGKGLRAAGLPGGHAFATTEITVMRPSSQLDSRYLAWILQSEEFRAPGEAHMTGAGGLKRVPESYAARYRVPHPNIDVQRAIADYLDRETAQIDAFIAKNEELITLLTERRSSVIARATTMGVRDGVDLVDSGLPWVGEIPAHWRVQPTRTVLRVSKSTVGADWSETPLLSLTKRGVIVRDIESGEGKFPASFEGYQRVYPGDLVFCLFDMDETPRTVGLVNGFGMLTGAYTRFSVNTELADARFLELYYVAIDDEKRFRPLYSGLRKVIKKDRFLSAGIPLPTLDEQREIVDAVGRKLDQIDHALSVAARGVALARERRAALISAAVTGKIDVGVAV